MAEPPRIDQELFTAALQQSDSMRREGRKMMLWSAIGILVPAPIVVLGTHRIFGVSWVTSITLTVLVVGAAFFLGMHIGKEEADKKLGPIRAELDAFDERLRNAKEARTGRD
jgi:hypothetical protein